MKRLKVSSFAIQGVFSFGCLANIILCLLHKANYDSELGRACSHMALSLTGILFFMLIGFGITSLILNLMVFHRESGSKRRSMLIWVITSPIIYIVLWFISLGVFIVKTGVI